MMRALPFLLVLLAGCAGDQRNTQAVRQDDPLGPAFARVLPPAEVLTEKELAGAVKEFRADVQASNNAMQQSMTALVGAEVGKVAERVDASLARINAQIETRLAAHAELNASARAELAAQFKADVRAAVGDLSAHAEAQAHALNGAVANLAAKVEAMGAAQVGLKNEMRQTQETVTAHRDAIVSTVEFNEEHQAVLVGAYETVLWTVGICTGVLVTLMQIHAVIVIRAKEDSRKRAEDRARDERALIRTVLPKPNPKGETHA